MVLEVQEWEQPQVRQRVRRLRAQPRAEQPWEPVLERGSEERRTRSWQRQQQQQVWREREQREGQRRQHSQQRRRLLPHGS